MKKIGRSKIKPQKLSKEETKKKIVSSIKKEQEKIKLLGLKDEIEFKYETNKWNVISLFSGCGGMDLGLLLGGLDVFNENENLSSTNVKDSVFNIMYVVDNFKEAIETHKRNLIDNGTYYDTRDIRKIPKFPKCDLVIGGFPCPGFSLGGPRLIDDERNFLYIHFIRALKDSKPNIFVAENVKGLLTLGKGAAFDQIKKDFEEAGYTVFSKLLNSEEYGVPQKRERVFIVGIKKESDYSYNFPSATHGGLLKKTVTLKDSIFDLKDSPGPLHVGDYSSIYMSRNRKKKWNDTSFTIQASGRQTPLHPSGPTMKYISKDKWIFTGGPSETRRLSVKETARIQTFPDWFKFYDEKNNISNQQIEKIYKQIGNAVPVQLARSVFLPIAEYAFGELKKRNKKRKRNKI